MSDDELMTVDEVAERIRAKPNTVRFWRATNDPNCPPLFKLGGRVLAKRSDIEQWIESQYRASVR